MALKGMIKSLGSRPVGAILGHSSSGLGESARLRLLDSYEKSGQGWFWATDPDGRLTYLSNAICDTLCKPMSELIGTPASEVFLVQKEGMDGEESKTRPLSFLFSARNAIVDQPVKAPIEDREIWWSISGRPSFDEEGRFCGYAGHGVDVTAQRQEQRDAAHLAQYDSLTGLANRHRMAKRLSSILTAYKSAKRSCAIMMLDLDRFKQVNDTLGHQAGDELLKQVAQRLERIVGQQGEIGRLGGDEFQVILPDVDDRGRLGELGARIIQMLSQPYTIEGSRCIIGASVGIAVAPYDGIDSEQLVRAADLALYAAKGGGRGQYRFYSSDLKDEAEERRLVEEHLRDALEHGQLEMQYQPIVRASDNIVVGFEALMRWDHPDRGPISPAVFIPIAEESNLIIALGEWALRTVCADAAKWPSKLPVSINVSAIQFAAPGFADVVAKALGASRIDPNQIVLEITESVFMGDGDANDQVFKALKSLGVKLALDDFGTGYSSLSYLSSTPFDKIKIDRSFVIECTEKDSNNAAIISAIIALAGALKMEVIVEGVEAFDQLELVCTKGAKFIQGWIYSPALSGNVIMERLEHDELRIEPEGPKKHRADRRSVFRKIGVIHGDYRYDVVMRDLSKTGARIEGLLGVPARTELVVDLGNGQLAVAKVVRSKDAIQGLEFETPLISDGAGGLCTRHRVSPYALAAAGMPLGALPPGSYPLVGGVNQTQGTAQFLQVEVNALPRSRVA